MQLTNQDLQNSSPGVIHRARDIIAPVVGYVAAGGSLLELGQEIEPALLLPSLVPVPRTETDGAISAEVIRRTRQGAAHLNIARDTLSSFGDVIILEFGDDRRVVRIQHPDEVNTRQLPLVDDEYGLLAIARGEQEGVVPDELAVGAEVMLREAT